MSDAKVAGGRVLLVDDSEEFLHILAWAMAESGFEVVTAETGDAALEELVSGGFDAMVIDLRLPDMSGADVIEQSRNLGLGLPTVVVSGYAGCLDASRFRDLGVECVLPKPIRMATLIEKVGEIIQRVERKEPAQ
jgi:DNA-binding response OmpR family regulator